MTNNNAFSGKTLRRSREHRMLSGVCGGIGEYFNIDATLIRIVLVPALMAVFGEWNWWLPGRAKRASPSPSTRST